ncbi:MAG TPA: hypothetical protein VK728_00705 [Candidatus Sulfotelmatobacter sp.]|nr:hypothetical protein [Candidatus Sulfotelmatobacter sp.]
MVVRSPLFRTRVVAVTVLGSVLFVTKLFAQGNAPAYLAEMPSVERVMQAMRASDPDETAARQMAAFTHLKNMIEKLAGPRFPKNQLTPEENKLRQAYYTAYWQISKSKPQYGSFNAMHGLDIDIKFRDEVIQKCFPPSFAAEYSKLTGQAIAQNKAFHDQGEAARAEREQARADQAAKENPNAQKITVADVQAQLASGGSKDPQELAMRRCIAAGRLPSSCTGNALLGSFSNMISSALSGVAGTSTNTAGSPTNVPPDAGPNMSGVFQGAGNWRLDFVDGGVLVNCSFLSPNQEAYSLAFRSTGAVLTINTKPKPLVLDLHADGTITGPPGTVTIDGVIASGYHTGLHNAAGQQVTANEARYSTQPVYNDSGMQVTDPGAVNGYSTFSPRRATCPAVSLTSKGTGPGIQTMQMNVLKTAFGGDAGPATPVGIRMHGIFAAPSTGFSLQFFPESVILGCGPISARAYPYAVSGSGLIKIDAADHPLSVTIRSDGSLDPGSGPYQVHGRMITGPTVSDKYAFLPVESTCNLAPLTPARNIPSAGGATPHP